MSTNSMMTTKKQKVFHREICSNFHEFLGEDHNKRKKDFYRKICENTVLAHKFWGNDQYFEGLRPRIALQGHRACYFLRIPSSLGKSIFCFWGTSSDWGGTAPKCPLVAPGLNLPVLGYKLAYFFFTLTHHITVKSLLYTNPSNL